jgi:hypothetical protein
MVTVEKQFMNEKIEAHSRKDLIKKFSELVNEIPLEHTIRLHVTGVFSGEPCECDDNGASLTHQRIMKSPLPAHAPSL